VERAVVAGRVAAEIAQVEAVGPAVAPVAEAADVLAADPVADPVAEAAAPEVGPAAAVAGVRDVSKYST
jgi:hypothetical protein